jgi:hypothetical protein
MPPGVETFQHRDFLCLKLSGNNPNFYKNFQRVIFGIRKITRIQKSFSAKLAIVR